MVVFGIVESRADSYVNRVAVYRKRRILESDLRRILIFSVHDVGYERKAFKIPRLKKGKNASVGYDLLTARDLCFSVRDEQISVTVSEKLEH